MAKLIDIIGKRYGRLTVLRISRRGNRRQYFYICLCDCGKSKEILGHDLGRNTRSCGCLQRELAGKRFRTHGLRRHRLYRIWYAMKQRCMNPNDGAWKYYGARGIKVCDLWQRSFIDFYNHVSQLEGFGIPGRSIDRIRNSGDYEPGNVQWATRKQQAANKRPLKAQKLSWADVIEIRRLAFDGMMHKTIAEKYPVSPSHISAIVRGEERKEPKGEYQS